MRRFEVLFGAFLFGCAGGTEPPKPPETSAKPPEAAVHVEDAGASVTVLAPPEAGPPTAPEEPLPPPKPTTIPLAQSGDTPEGRELIAGDAAFEKGDWASAQLRYEAAKKAAPNHVAARVGLARLRIAKSGAALDYGAAKGNAEVASAMRELRAATTQDAAFGPAHAELGRALLQLGDADGALASLQRAAQLLPNDPEVQSALGVALIATGKKDESLAPLKRSVDLDPGSAARHGNLGTVLLLLGRVAESVHEFELQARLADGDARAHSDLGTALLAENQMQRAVSELERAVALDGKRASYRTNLGYAYQMLGRRTDAIAQYREALRVDDKFASAWINLATALAQDPKTRGEARAALLTAKKIDPSDPRVKANLDELDALEKTSPSPH